MDLINKFKYKLAYWMQDRYGMDSLYKALLTAMLIFLLLNIFFPSFIFYVLSLASGAAAIFRSFSKNSSKRVAENQIYLRLKDKAKKKTMQLINRIKEWKTHRYRACPSCKTTLRLPKKLGINHVKCPVCKNETDFNIRF